MTFSIIENKAELIALGQRKKYTLASAVVILLFALVIGFVPIASSQERVSKESAVTQTEAVLIKTQIV
jgi:hypothetical protein